MGVQFFVFLLVVGAGVAAAGGGEFDAVDEFDVGAVVEFVRVTGRRVLDEEADWPAVLRRQRSAVELIDHDPFIENRREWDAGSEAVGCRVQCEIRGLRLRFRFVENGPECHAVPTARRMKPADIADLVRRR